MVTIRRMTRLTQTGAHTGLLRELLAGRTENVPGIVETLNESAAAEALAIIRLEELGRGNAPEVSGLIRSILRRQEADGGWHDPMTTALCLRALLCWSGQGVAVDAGLGFLARLQRDDGLWPREPLRRMPSDPLSSAFVLFQLCQSTGFREAVRFDHLVGWFEHNQPHCELSVRRLWNAAALRRRLMPQGPSRPSPLPAVA